MNLAILPIREVPPQQTTAITVRQLATAISLQQEAALAITQSPEHGQQRTIAATHRVVYRPSQYTM